jgi:hypothetical protein
LVPAVAFAAPKPPKKPDKAAEKAAKEKAEQEKAEQEKAEQEKAEQEKAAAAKAEKEKDAAAAKAEKKAGGGNGGSGGGGGGGGDPDDKPGKSGEPDVDTLRQEYLSLRDELFKSRARANAVASQLYSTRVQIKLTYTSGRYYTPAKSAIRLDGAGVYEDASGAIGGDDGVRFTGFVAPGKHTITFRVEAAGKDDPTFGSVTETQIVVQAVAGKDLLVAAKAHDSGDIATEWKRKEKGSYGLGIDVAVKSAARADEAPKAPAATAANGGKK